MSIINKNNYEAWFLDYSEGNLNSDQVAELLLFIELHPELKSEFEQFDIISLNETIRLSNEEKNALKKPEIIINHNQAEEWLIRYVENDLTNSEKNEIEKWAFNNPKIASEIKLFQLTKINHNNEVSAFNSLLKKLTFNELVQVENKELMLIHLTENLFTSEEEKIVIQLINSNPELKKEWDHYQKTKITPEQIIYPNKLSLKKKNKIVPLFPVLRYTSYAAAASLILYFLIGNSPVEKNNESFFAFTKLIQNTDQENNNREKNNTVEEYIPGERLNKTYETQSYFSNNNTPKNRIDFDDKRYLPYPNEDDILVLDTSENQIDPPINTINNSLANHSDSIPSEEVALSANEPSKSNYLTPKELIIKKINKKLFNKDQTTFGKEEIQKSTEMGLSSITGKETTVSSTQTDDVSQFTFALGGFEISRKKSK